MLKIFIILIAMANVKPDSIDMTIDQVPSGVHFYNLGQGYVEKGAYQIKKEYPKTELEASVKFLKKIETKNEGITHKVEKTLKNFNELISLCEEHAEEIPRTKRGLFGDFLTAVFGVNDEALADIAELKKQNTDLFNFTNDISSWVYEKIQKEETIVEQKINEVMAALGKEDKNMQLLANVVNKVMEDQKIMEKDFKIYQAVEELFETSQAILRALQSTSTLTDHFKTNEIKTKIEEVNKQVVNSIVLFEPGKIATELYSDGILVSLNLPFVHPQIFTIYHAFGLPHHLKNNTFALTKVSHEYLGYSSNSSEVFMSEKLECSMRHRQKPNAKYFICHNKEIRDYTPDLCLIRDLTEHHKNESSCEIDIVHFENNIVKQLHDNVFFYYLKDEKKTGDLVCGSTRKKVRINSTGIMHLTSLCHFELGSVIIGNKWISENSIIVSKMKQINLIDIDEKIVNATNAVKLTVVDSGKTFKFPILKKLEGITRVWNPMRDHSHSLLICVIALVAIIVLITYMIIKRK